MPTVKQLPRVDKEEYNPSQGGLDTWRDRWFQTLLMMVCRSAQRTLLMWWAYARKVLWCQGHRTFEVPGAQVDCSTTTAVLDPVRPDRRSMSPLVLEEDIIKICVRLEHSHPVLCYSATESVILCWLADDMQCTTHGAMKAMVLHEEAIAIRASAPFWNPHEGLYDCSGCGTFQNPTSTLRGERNLIPPLVTPRVGELCTISNQTLAI